MSRTRKPREKSPSEELRGVFYGLWQNNHEKFVNDFDGYYDFKMKLLIEHYKKLNK